MIFLNIINGLAPSIFADSYSSPGIFIRIPLTISIVTGTPIQKFTMITENLAHVPFDKNGRAVNTLKIDGNKVSVGEFNEYINAEAGTEINENNLAFSSEIMQSISSKDLGSFLNKYIPKKITKTDLIKASSNFIDENTIKGAVDIERRIMAVDAPMHYECEQLLLENGSRQENIWGINLYLDEDNIDDLVEFDSMINIRPAEGNRSRGVESEETRARIKDVVEQWLI